MAVPRILVAQDNSEENQWLKVDHNSRFIQNNCPEWQFLFGIDSTLSTSQYVLKVTARFDDTSMNNIKLVGYLYNTVTAAVGSLDSCEFKIFKVELPEWTETLLDTFMGAEISNTYFYVNKLMSDFAPAELDGSTALMIECTAVRLGITYRDRVYLNHLGVYDSVIRLRNEVNFLEVMKVDE